MAGLHGSLCMSVAISALLLASDASAHNDAAICRHNHASQKGHIEPPLKRLAQNAHVSETATDVDEVDKAALTRELAEMLQACSYDGSILHIAADELEGATQPEMVAQVEQIMSATGLPQNFDVIEASVPNASAMIVFGGNNIPRRVIAYNPDFMQEITSSNLNTRWMATSIMAHEVGHHLSGHTLVPGGSQPPLELEADRFSGFVLARMGASEDAATQAIRTLVPEEGSATHPERAKRLSAILLGWRDACADGCAGQQAPDRPLTVTPDSPKEDREDGSEPAPAIDKPAEPPKTPPAERPLLTGPTNLPALDPDSVPGKFSRFVYDPDNHLNAEIKAQLEADAYAFAKDPGVEIVTLLVDDLQDLTGQEYAEQFLRQYRVGKLDVGNGAVIVAAPASDLSPEESVGVAFGPGLVAAMGPDSVERNRQQVKSFVETVRAGGEPDVVTIAMGLSYPADAIMRNATASNVEWYVRYPSLGDALQAKEEYDAHRAKSGEEYDPAKDPLYGKIVTARITLNNMQPIADEGTVLKARSALYGPRLDVTSLEGLPVTVHAFDQVQDLMPVPLEAGKTYQMVMRMVGTTDGKPAGSLMSYALVSE